VTCSSGVCSNLRLGGGAGTPEWPDDVGRGGRDGPGASVLTGDFLPLRFFFLELLLFPLGGVGGDDASPALVGRGSGGGAGADAVTGMLCPSSEASLGEACSCFGDHA